MQRRHAIPSCCVKYLIASIALLLLFSPAASAWPPSPQDRANELIELGDSALGNGKFSQAREAYEKALNMFQKLGEQKSALYTLLRLGGAYSRQDRYAEASIHYERALKFAETQSDKGYCLQFLAENYRKQALPLKALKRFEEASAIFDGLDPKENSSIFDYHVNALAGLGAALADLSQYRDALLANQKALVLLTSPQTSLQKKLKGRILYNSGIMQSRLGNCHDALEDLRQAQDIFEALESFDDLSASLAGIGGVYEEWGRDDAGKYLDALDMYHDALAIRRQKGLDNSRHTATLLNNIGKVLDRLGRDMQVRQYHEQALAYYEKALALYRELHIQDLGSSTLNNLGEAHLHLSAYRDRENHLEESSKHLVEAEQIQRRLLDRRRRWVTLDNLGRVFEVQGESAKALEYYKESIEVMESIVGDAGVAELKMHLSAQTADLYRRTIVLLLHLGEAQQAFEFSERARARAFLDMLGNARREKLKDVPKQLLEQENTLQTHISELEFRLAEFHKKPNHPEKQEQLSNLEQELSRKQHEYENLLTELEIENPASAALLRIPTPGLEDIQAQLDSRTTLLSYFVTPEKSIAFVMSKERFHAIELHIEQRKLEKLVKAFREDRNLGDSQSETLKKLYAHLIEPLEHYLETPVIGIIPHDTLHYLPFSALTDGKHFLGEEFRLFRLPAASVFKHSLAEKRAAGKGSVPKSVLAMANSYAPGLDEIPGSVNEVKAIKYFYGRYYRSRLYMSDKKKAAAAENVLKEQAGDHQIVHLTSHGILNSENPLHSQLVFSPESDEELSTKNGNEGKLNVYEIYDLDLEQTELVVLSGCETQLGKRSKGDDIVGLTRAFLYAGASSVIASLWQVDDRATRDFMKHFYLQLALRQSPADALRVTRRIMRREYPHPYFWAGFVLTGLP